MSPLMQLYLFNQAAIDTYGATMAFIENDEDVIAKAPAEYKTGTKWKAFKEGSIAYLNCSKGSHNIPLAIGLLKGISWVSSYYNTFSLLFNRVTSNY